MLPGRQAELLCHAGMSSKKRATKQMSAQD